MHLFKREKKNDKPTIETILNKSTPFAITESYKTARTNILFALADKKGSKTVVITGAGRAEGKSTSCVNLGITFAELGAKAIILDCDLRRPNIHRKFGIKNKRGVSDILCGLCTAREVIHTSEQYGIDFISAGQMPPNPAELLSMTSMDDLIADLSQRYEYIFIDTPPLTVVTDAAVVSKKADGVIFVVRQNHATKEEVDRALKNLKFADAHLLGFLMNDVDVKGHGYGYRYGKYSYSYGYGGPVADKASNRPNKASE